MRHTRNGTSRPSPRSIVNRVYSQACVLALWVSLACSGGGTPPTSGDLTRECDSPKPGWIWCDDFEEDRLSSYFEYNSAGGSFSRVGGAGVDGSAGMRARFSVGQVGAGSLHLAFGRTPSSYFRPVDAGAVDYREIYWRFHLKNQPGWMGGGGDKLSRATVFANASWAQAMIAHVWSGSQERSANHLSIDPARGTDGAGNLLTTRYNDFPNLTWLGSALSSTPLFDPAHVGEWHCIEVGVRLNDPGQSNGWFRLWINGEPEAHRSGLNFLGAYDAYGVNAIFLENYWNAGSPGSQERVFDNLVVSTVPIGC